MKNGRKTDKCGQQGDVVAMERRDDGGLSQKVVIEMEKTDAFKRYSRLDLLS